MTYPALFTGTSVVECGSRDHNGSVRIYFRDTKKYIGVDWKPGDNVDVVSLIHDLPEVEKYDVVISASLLEHDPYWEKSITKMVALLAEKGVLMLTWGAAKNGVHCLDDAPDGLFHPLPAGRVLRKLDELGVYVHEFIYEMELSRQPAEQGCVALLAFKDPLMAVGPQRISELDYEDTL